MRILELTVSLTRYWDGLEDCFTAVVDVVTAADAIGDGPATDIVVVVSVG